MEISGKIIELLEPVTGEGRNGPWKKQEFIIETQEEYPRKVCIAVWGDKINLSGFDINDQIKVSINIESREYNGRWYTDVKAWRAEKLEGDESKESADAPQLDTLIPPDIPDEQDDLPF